MLPRTGKGTLNQTELKERLGQLLEMDQDEFCKALGAAPPKEQENRLNPDAKAQYIEESEKQRAQVQESSAFSSKTKVESEPPAAQPTESERFKENSQKTGRKENSKRTKRAVASEAILQFISKHPNCKCADIGKGAGIKPPGLSQHLNYIRGKNWVITEGSRRGMTYKISEAGRKLAGNNAETSEPAGIREETTPPASRTPDIEEKNAGPAIEPDAVKPEPEKELSPADLFWEHWIICGKILRDGIKS